MNKEQKLLGTALALALGVALTTPAAALDCSNGVGFKGANGEDYCVSTIKMNWFSAFSWCKAAGGKLATLGEACPGTKFDTCTNIKGKQSEVSDYAWVATPEGDNLACSVKLSSGGVNFSGDRLNNYYVLCK